MFLRTIRKHQFTSIPSLLMVNSFFSTLRSDKCLPNIKLQNTDDTETKQLGTLKHSSLQQYVETTRALDPSQIWGTTIAPPDPDLPVNTSEVNLVDPSHSNQVLPSLDTGENRIVHIRQEQASVSQSPLRGEKKWIISLQDEGETSQCWGNPLMGWVSSSDSCASNLSSQMRFKNASDAVYFAKKRGWEYIVEEPMIRKVRDDNAAYQDNFLPQDIAVKVRRENIKCGHWHRELAGTSHYFRPLTYHGIGTVNQHGPDSEQDIVPHVQGYSSVK